MELKRLEYFIALAESKSFSETAELLYTTQGNVSKQIAALEKELDAQLVDRSRRQFALTAAGEALLVHAPQLISDYHSLTQAVSLASQSQQNTIRICSIPVMAHYDITGYLSEFSHENPDIRLSIQEREGSNILKELDKNLYDFAFIRTNGRKNDELEVIPLCRDCFAVVLWAHHPLSIQKEIDLKELHDENFLQLDNNSLLYEMFLDACREWGFQPHISYTGTRMENILELVANEMGISLMMQKAALYVKTPGVKIIPLKQKITSEISLVRLKNRQYSACEQKFWNYMLKEAD